MKLPSKIAIKCDFGLFMVLRKYSKIVPEYAEIVQICNFAATLLPPIFPLNRAFNAIWWQGGSKN
jgi:hypothetical protein